MDHGTGIDDRARSYLSLAPGPALVSGDDGLVRNSNEEMATLYGCSAAELEGASLATLVDPASGSGTGLDARCVRPDGTSFAATVSIRPFETDGETFNAVSIEPSASPADSGSERAAELGRVAHDLRSPLASILGYTELLGDTESGRLSEAGVRALAVIRRNAAREWRLVRDLILLMRADAGVFEIEDGAANITDLATASVNSAQTMAETAGVELQLAAAPVADLRGDPGRLAQLFDHLLTNAIRHSPDGGTVWVRVAAEADQVVVEVADQGPGIAQADRERVFDRYFRSGDAVAGPIGGLGVGLAIVAMIAEAHGAKAEVDDGPDGRGATLRVRIPASSPLPGSYASVTEARIEIS